MTKKRIGTILTVILLLFVFGTIFLFFNSFFGNPVSASIAKYKISRYVKKEYPDKDLDISKAQYNFKNHDYFCIVQSKDIKDMRFQISLSGKNIRDSYEFDVAGKYQTFVRLTNEFDKKVEALIESAFPYPTDILIADFDKSDGIFSNLSLDMPLDITNPPYPAYLTVYMFSEEISYDFLCARLLELHNLMQTNRIPFELYTLVIREPMPDGEKPNPDGESLHLFDFPVEKLESEDLIAAIKEHMKAYENEHDK